MKIIRQILPEDGLIADYILDLKTNKGTFVLYIETDTGMQRMKFDPTSTFIVTLISIARKTLLGNMGET